MTAKINRIGNRYGRWTVVSEAKRTHSGKARWICVCDCGNRKEVAGYSLACGDSKSCGCLHNELASEAIRRGSEHPLLEARRQAVTTHGKCKTKEYRAWAHIIGRCHTPSDRAYGDYGGRGIFVCEQWRNSFETFLEDIGEAPPHTTLDRKDNDGPYSKENCRWATRTEQNRNKRNNRYLEFQGGVMTIAGWAERFGLPASAIWKRLNRGWSVEKSLTTPIQTRLAVFLRA